MSKSFFIPFNNKTIKGNLHKNNNSNKLIIICHGYKDTKDLYVYKRISELLSVKYNIYRFNFTDIEAPNLKEEVNNITWITNYFSNKYKDIIILGASLGGLSTVLNSINNSRLNKVILVNPFIYYFKKVAWRFRKILLTMLFFYPFVKEVRNNLNYYFLNLKPNLINKPILLIVAENDEMVSPLHGKTLFEKIESKNKKLILDKNIDHGLTKEEYINTVVNYIFKWLK